MKSKIVSLLVLWALPLLAGSARAQNADHSSLTVRVPFEFVVGNRTFPAGTYKFRSLLNSVADHSNIEILEVRNVEGGFYSAMVTDVVTEVERSHPRLVFAHVGGRAVLSEVWEAGKPVGCRIQKRRDDMQAEANEKDKFTLTASADWR